MDQYIDTAYNVTSQLFGSDSGIPWWAWFVVAGAIMFKILIPQPKTAEDRDAALVAAIAGGEGGKKGKKKKK